ncbi:MAG TPA: histidine--tRNA ligase [Candidatus Dojkabacteria bacterium]|jgi:histidyl-tRNA synthetase
MKKQQITNLKGFRDFLPKEKRARNFVVEKIVEIFETYGFQPIETPTLEAGELLKGKYGEEADKLLYSFKDRGDRDVALRYDQTVPTARIVTQYKNELPKYFRRYQIQNVYRAEKPQKGRFREFTQCDIDIFGSTSFLTDAEILACAYGSYKNVGFKNVEILINDREVLFSNLEKYATEKVSVMSIIQSIDKLDKMSEEAIVKELVAKGLKEPTAKEALKNIQNAPQTEILEKTIKAAKKLGIDESSLIFNPTLARGLDYYNSIIWEVVIPEYKVGSVGGGGRYDNLLNELIGEDIPATGMAFGFDRIVEAAIEQNLIPQKNMSTTVLVAIVDEAGFDKSMEVAKNIRKKGIKTEVYMNEDDKLGKQFKYADQNNFKYVVLVGGEEAAKNVAKVKFMDSGKEKEVQLNQIGEYFSGLTDE